VAPGAAIQIPAAVDPSGGPSALVNAEAAEQQRANRYSITILAEPLSTRPSLKSVTDYVNSASALAGREGAQSIHEAFAYLISGIEFIGVTLELPDGADFKHFQGIFTTTMKGYLLTVSVTAASEQRVLDLASAISLTRGE
jgi:hypothetical protein